MELLDLNPGKQFAGRYTIQKLLGEGGMGKVYLATDSLLNNEELALKLLHGDLTRDERHTKRFLREVQLTRKVTHTNIVRTFDVGWHEGLLYFTMEYAPGLSLKELAATGVEPYRYAKILLGICEGLSAIHDVGIIHRDLKPGNVIMVEDDKVKITDFGVARPGQSDMTGHNEVVGSTAYMAPEIWSGKEVTPATDFYALGVMSYEVLTNTLPFDGKSPAEVMCKHLEHRPESPIKLNPQIPLWLDSLIMRMLEKEPKKRPSSAKEIIQIIDEKLNRKKKDVDPAVLGSSAALELMPSGIGVRSDIYAVERNSASVSLMRQKAQLQKNNRQPSSAMVVVPQKSRTLEFLFSFMRIHAHLLSSLVLSYLFFSLLIVLRQAGFQLIPGLPSNYQTIAAASGALVFSLFASLAPYLMLSTFFEGAKEGIANFGRGVLLFLPISLIYLAGPIGIAYHNGLLQEPLLYANYFEEMSHLVISAVTFNAETVNLPSLRHYLDAYWVRVFCFGFSFFSIALSFFLVSSSSSKYSFRSVFLLLAIVALEISFVGVGVVETTLTTSTITMSSLAVWVTVTVAASQWKLSSVE